jgi:hypothetical protein
MLSRATIHDKGLERFGASVCTSHACGGYMGPLWVPQPPGATKHHACGPNIISRAHNPYVMHGIRGLICGVIEDCEGVYLVPVVVPFLRINTDNFVRNNWINKGIK